MAISGFSRFSHFVPQLAGSFPSQPRDLRRLGTGFLSKLFDVAAEMKAFRPRRALPRP